MFLHNILHLYRKTRYGIPFALLKKTAFEYNTVWFLQCLYSMEPQAGILTYGSPY